MYNLLVSANDKSWSGEPFEIELSRVVREHTADPFTQKYGALDSDAIAALMTFPAIFAFETGNNKPAHIGRITEVRHRNRTVRVEYEIDQTLPEIPPEIFLLKQWDLNIDEWEMNRTHWALKDVDLFAVLTEAGIIKPVPQAPRATSADNLADFEAQPQVFKIPDAKREPDLVSVMMPFDKSFDLVYAALKKACKEARLRCDRVDDIWEESEVIQDIFSLLYRSQFVICDFTGANPNVFYETGIAHTLGRQVIPISQNGKHVPFDLRHHRYVEYQMTDSGLNSLAASVTKRLTTLRERQR